MSAEHAPQAQNMPAMVQPGWAGSSVAEELRKQCGGHCVAELEKFEADYAGTSLSDALLRM